ncbi:serine protease [Aestuariibius sp. 2305UL40-4]|uniref:serine protease n=1 Tax=Aestuariibius violaceus TaxID=3234132 RepID=UPI00345E54EC
MRPVFYGYFLAFLLGVTGLARPAAAQDAWIQIEARPSLAEATDRARFYANRLNDVSGFSLRSGWYSIVLGPYAEADAEALARQLLRDGLIPRDSFIATGTAFERRFWPAGAGAQVQVTPIPLVIEEAPSVPAVLPDEQFPIEPEETVSQARAGEAQLTRPERERLQRALEWAGTYNGAIDGLFGRGTRDAMAVWQEQNRYRVTGVLTTAQRTALLEGYDAVLDGLGLRMVAEDRAGIEMMMPTEAVRFDAYAPPFARYTADGVEGAQLLLISQAGDSARMAGLYEILQTLAIIPPDGDRRRTDTAFRIEGANDRISTFALGELRDGTIKGFILVWPAGDEARRTRLVTEMRASFRFLPGVLEDAVPNPDDQQLGEISGLEIRKPLRARTGAYITEEGHVLTASEAVDGCSRITIDDSHEATVALTDDALGLTVLAPATPVSPPGIARFQTRTPRIESELAVSGYPYEGLLNAPSMTFGTLADIQGLGGERHLMRLDLPTEAGDAGGPVLDLGGNVVGMALPASESRRQLPDGVSFMVDADAIASRLTEAGYTLAAANDEARTTPERLTKDAARITVLVGCWD